MFYGQTSVRNTKVRLDLIESILIIVNAAAMFAELVNASELWVIDPDPDIEGLYNKAGFGARENYHAEVGAERIGQRMKL